MLHPLLERHLKRAELAADALPTDAVAWREFLERVSRAYTEADQDRYLLERSLSISSTEMRDLHVQLATERDTLKTVIVSLAEGLCALDAEGRVLFINPAAQRLLGLTGGSCAGGRLADLVDIRDAQGRRLEEIVAEACAPGGQPPAGCEGGDDKRLIVRGDTSSYVVYAASPMVGGRGAVLAMRDISERKRAESERDELNRKLVEASRRAGMAEVATGVLHNVGNVLNSVNVSASLAADRMRRSRVGGVEKAASLLLAHEADMASFLSADPAGRELPKYLGALAACLASEQKETLRELEELTKNVDHIKTIVGMQQAHAKGGGVREMEDIAALAEDALRVCAMELERHGVPVERRFEAAPRVLADRHQVLQILINLIRNAKQAVAATPAPRRPVVLRVGPDGAGGVRVRVEDSGVGIAAENLTRIFQHGFTTKTGGHGFGLHSAALAAKNMGASLTVESDGPGRGAAFTLAFPGVNAGVAA